MRAFLLASALLLGAPAHAQTVLTTGQTYEGTIVACAQQSEAETLLGYVVHGDMDTAKTYLADDGNTCSVGPAPFLVKGQVGIVQTDPKGNAWKLVQIVLPSGTEGYLLTTSPLEKKGSDT
jgi:hypothetical protein